MIVTATLLPAQAEPVTPRRVNLSVNAVHLQCGSRLVQHKQIHHISYVPTISDGI